MPLVEDFKSSADHLAEIQRVRRDDIITLGIRFPLRTPLSEINDAARGLMAKRSQGMSAHGLTVGEYVPIAALRLGDD